MSSTIFISKFRENKITFGRVTKSEWIKFRSIRSNWITVLLTMVVIVGFGVLSAILSQHRSGPSDRTPLDRVLTGANFAVLIISVLGSVLGAKEFSSGMIKTAFTTVPRRLPVLFNKIIIFVSTVLPALLISILAAFFIGSSIFKHYGTAIPHWGDPFIARSLIGFALYILGLGIIGLCIGMLTRNTAASIGIVVGGVLFLPALLGALLPTSWRTVLEYLPSNAGAAFTTPTAISVNSLSPTTGGVVFVAWIVGILLLTSWAVRSRDV